MATTAIPVTAQLPTTFTSPIPVSTHMPAEAPTPNPIATSQPSRHPTQIAQAELNELRFLALGDSYTIGQSVEGSERWPVQLVRRIREAGVKIADPEIIAQTGWTTGELSAALEEGIPKGTYDIVSLLIGVNNQFRGLDINQYRTEFANLLQRAVTLAGGNSSHVIVVSIPDWGVTPFAQGLDRDLIAQQINLFNSVSRMEAARAGSRYVDVTGISRKAVTQLSLLAVDGLHPSGEMYSQWADVVLPAALEIVPISVRR